MNKIVNAMLFTQPLTWVILCNLVGGCTQKSDVPQTNVSVPNATNRIGNLQSDDDNYQKQKDEALAHTQTIIEERMRNPPTNEVPLPNFDTGPGRPLPVGVDFYETHDYYPGYLLCTYEVNESRYDQTGEPMLFKSALLQIRNLGPRKFPPIKMIAVIILSRGEYQGVSTFEQSHKAGAVFNASDVFDWSRDLPQVVSQAHVDRHPFKYDPKGQPKQRWLIVERDSATNHANIN